jgi:TolA-binding protein
MSHHDPLRDLAKDLPWDRPDPARRDAVRDALLVAAEDTLHGHATPTHARRWLFVAAAFSAGALAAAAIAIIIVRTRSSEPSSLARITTTELRTVTPARVTAPTTTQLEHIVTPTPTGIDETVRIHDGTVHLAVGPIRTGDHLRVGTRDAIVEGAGEYDVVVVADSLSAVTVRTGTAQIRIDGQHTVVLAAGQTWRATIITADLSTPTSDVRTPDKTTASDIRTPDRASTSGTRTPDKASTSDDGRTPDPASTSGTQAVGQTAEGSGGGNARRRVATATEVHFSAGWALLRAGKVNEAAVEFGAAADARPDDPLAGDARYFQAVALVRAGQKAQAEKVLVAFLDHAPRSLRRGRAAVLVGRLLAERGDVESARAWYTAAVDDPDPATAKGARDGLDALPSRR